MQDRQVDRAAGFFLSNKRFIDFMNHRYFENNLRQAGLLDIWRQSKQGTEMSYLIQGESVTQEDRFTEFLRFVNNYCGGRKAVAQVCLTISVGFLAFDSKKAKETANNILNIITLNYHNHRQAFTTNTSSAIVHSYGIQTYVIYSIRKEIT